VFLLSIFSAIIVFAPIVATEHPESDLGLLWILMAPVLLIVLLSVASAKAVSRRLIFLAIGLLLLIALNELSKLGLDLTAPKLQG
jgi:ABC-type polysaccharide/polyol phosphate export permease